MDNTSIQHRGIISKINEKIIEVKILSESACASCHARGFCSSLDSTEKVFLIPFNPIEQYEIGEEVNLSIESNKGLAAVLWAYFIPFVLLLSSIIIFVSIIKNEGLAGISAIAVVGLYYFILYLFRNKLNKKFCVKIHKLL